MAEYTVNFRNPAELDLDGKAIIFHVFRCEAENKNDALIKALNCRRKSETLNFVFRHTAVFEVIEKTETK